MVALARLVQSGWPTRINVGKGRNMTESPGSNNRELRRGNNHPRPLKYTLHHMIPCIRYRARDERTIRAARTGSAGRLAYQD